MPLHIFRKPTFLPLFPSLPQIFRKMLPLPVKFLCNFSICICRTCRSNGFNGIISRSEGVFGNMRCCNGMPCRTGGKTGRVIPFRFPRSRVSCQRSPRMSAILKMPVRTHSLHASMAFRGLLSLGYDFSKNGSTLSAHSAAHIASNFCSAFPYFLMLSSNLRHLFKYSPFK